MYSEILHGSCNSVVLHAADKSFLSFISKYWLRRGNDFLTHILKLCQQKTSFQGHLLCVLNFRSFLLATSSRTSSFPSKYRKREDTQVSNRYLVETSTFNGWQSLIENVSSFILLAPFTIFCLLLRGCHCHCWQK